MRDEGEILSILVVDPSATYESLQVATGFSRAKVARILRRMREHGIIQREGSDKTGTWRIIQGGGNG